ncbi:SRPBCC domain-containing protein [Nonlabens antarcticus]|uniref:SRPBCC domain-containing protein n=1 Tax=Nonlabens antarcticus TaxID=392714 RepID=UPI001891850E|nr:SRPBCC domain-containing protein [Nonlabens antarcticus]
MKITIERNIIATIDEVWKAFNNPDDILKWDYTDEWKTTWVSNDLKVGGKLLLRIENSENWESVDFSATYTKIKLHRLIEFQDHEERMVCLKFIENDNKVIIRQTFDAISTLPETEQRIEWQSVLDRFAQYVEEQ